MSDVKMAMIVGVGPGLGASLARKFAAAGYLVVVAARQPQRLDDLILEIKRNGGNAKAYKCDAGSEISVANLFSTSISEFGKPAAVVFNAGVYVPNSILDTTSEEFQRCWEIGCLGGFHVGQAAAKCMVQEGAGTIIFTGATAAHRGGAKFHNLAVPKFGLRALTQSMARELGPMGIHVAHVVIDGIIESDERGRTELQYGEGSLLQPDSIADNYLMLHEQDRTAWTMELDLRPWVEKF